MFILMGVLSESVMGEELMCCFVMKVLFVELRFWIV